jgi:hypothetical protein
MVYGDFTDLSEGDKYLYVYTRSYNNKLAYYVNPLRFKAREYTLREFQRASKLLNLSTYIIISKNEAISAHYST